MNNIERRDKGLAYISDDSIMEEQKKCRQILQKLNFMDRSDFAGIAEVVKELLGSEGTASEGNKSPVREFYTSDEPELFEQVAAPFLGEGLPSGTKHFTTDKYEVTV